MLCKIARPDEETEPLVWRRLGPEQPNGIEQKPTAQSTSVRSLPPIGGPAVQPPRIGATPKHPPRASEAMSQMAGLHNRISELEAQCQVEANHARQAGFEQGLRKAREEAASEMQGALDKLAETIRDVAQVKRKIRSEAETELVKLALAIAKRILHREVSADPESLRGIVYAALQRLQNREISRIRVYPAAVQAVRSALERNGGLAAIEIVPDALLKPGGILFETALGELDASVDTQLLEIERGFADRLNG